MNEFAEPGSSSEYSIVISVDNERDCLRELYSRLTAVVDGLPGEAELVFVDDELFDLTFAICVLHHVNAGEAEARYIAFFPWRGRMLRLAEVPLGRLPLGAQYAVTGARG